MKIDEIAKTNPWWRDKTSINNDEKIQIAEKSGMHWDRGEIFKLEKGLYSIRGPRQTGKTTWVKLRIRELLENGADPRKIFYLSCEKIVDFKELIVTLEEYASWVRETELIIFLDEISFVKDWQRGIKFLIDRGDLAKSTIIVTGSSSLDVSKAVERLPGRTGAGRRHFLFYPMTFREYAASRNKLTELLKKRDLEHDFPLYTEEANNLLLDYCKTGGIGRAVSWFVREGRIPTHIYDTYSAWLIGDLAKAEKRENLARQIISKAIESYSTSLNWSSIAKGTSAESHSTIADYVETLDKLFFFQFVYTFAQHKKGAVFPKNKKIYFSDPFFFSLGFYMTRNIEKPFDFCSDFLMAKDNQGKLIEGLVLNAIVAELNRRTERDDFDYKNSIFFWSGRKGEVDFVLSKEGQTPLGIEVKWRERPRMKESPFKKTIILTEKDYDPERGMIPVALFLLEPDRYLL